MGETKNTNGEGYLQTAKLHEPWFRTFRCLSLQEEELIKNNYRLGVLKSAERNPIIIPPNREMTIERYAYKTLPYHQTVALIQATGKSVIPKDLDII
jgi:hypothetical protein